MPEAVLDGIDLEPLLAAGIAGCVVRETFEETGLLLGSGGQRNDLPGWRNRLLRKEVSFNQAVEYAKWRLDVSRLVYAGRWLTPPLGPIRFDNRFFLLEWAVDEPVQPEVCGSELVAGEWIRPKEALARWRRGDVVTAPPILHILTVLSESGPISGLDRLRSPLETNLGPHRRIEFRPGVLLFPLPTRTLPPANHTNTFVLGTGELVVVDPGSPYPEQNEGLIAALRDLESTGHAVTGVWLTHHHPDHVGGVGAVSRAFGVPIFAHTLTAERLAVHGIRVDEELHDGQRIVLAGEPRFPVRVIHTPGHARGHLAFLDETFGSLLGGDLTAGFGTIVIDPPEGNLDDYLASLRKVRALGARTLFPSHGPPTVAVTEKMDEYIRHRLWREERVLECWRRGLRHEDLFEAVYADTPSIAWPLARRQLLAHLERLDRRGEIA
jgi:glyoxylase-like metal-dependent hydrolase (beta-lactamase superfamily II)/8-oxo-dGTP pyrophosphatase MutT (NUDIX family)